MLNFLLSSLGERSRWRLWPMAHGQQLLRGRPMVLTLRKRLAKLLAGYWEATGRLLARYWEAIGELLGRGCYWNRSSMRSKPGNPVLWGLFSHGSLAAASSSSRLIGCDDPKKPFSLLSPFAPVCLGLAATSNSCSASYGLTTYFLRNK